MSLTKSILNLQNSTGVCVCFFLLKRSLTLAQSGQIELKCINILLKLFAFFSTLLKKERIHPPVIITLQEFSTWQIEMDYG